MKNTTRNFSSGHQFIVSVMRKYMYILAQRFAFAHHFILKICKKFQEKYIIFNQEDTDAYQQK